MKLVRWRGSWKSWNKSRRSTEMRHCIWGSKSDTRDSQRLHRMDRVKISVKGKYRRYQRKERGLWALMAGRSLKIVSHYTSIQSFSPKTQVDTSPTQAVLKIARQSRRPYLSKNHWTLSKTWLRILKSKGKAFWGRLAAEKHLWLILTVVNLAARLILRASVGIPLKEQATRVVVVSEMAA